MEPQTDLEFPTGKDDIKVLPWNLKLARSLRKVKMISNFPPMELQTELGPQKGEDYIKTPAPMEFQTWRFHQVKMNAHAQFPPPRNFKLTWRFH